ncbi:MAG: 5-formyltetrahydrofolate cyclo-ligase [Endozoicomonas sp.]
MTRIPMDRAELRKQLRQKRRSLSAVEQARAEENLVSVICSRPEFIKCQHIAFYIASDGEISPRLCVEKTWALGKHCYLPVLDPETRERMHFLPYKPDTRLVKNRFGIPEPEYDQSVVFPAEKLDLVLMPLTGFDEAGNRLGMGGGFYDRTFSFPRHDGKPLLFGLAHECQKVESITAADWDIPMQGIATEKAFYSVSD